MPVLARVSSRRMKAARAQNGEVAHMHDGQIKDLAE